MENLDSFVCRRWESLYRARSTGAHLERGFLGRPVVKTATPVQGSRVQSQVGELRSCMDCKEIQLVPPKGNQS